MGSFPGYKITFAFYYAMGTAYSDDVTIHRESPAACPDLST